MTTSSYATATILPNSNVFSLRRTDMAELRITTLCVLRKCVYDALRQIGQMLCVDWNSYFRFACVFGMWYSGSGRRNEIYKLACLVFANDSVIIGCAEEADNVHNTFWWVCNAKWWNWGGKCSEQVMLKLIRDPMNLKDYFVFDHTTLNLKHVV